MEMPRAYVREIDPPLFKRIFDDIKNTGEYRSRNTVYVPVNTIIWLGLSGSQPVHEEPVQEPITDADILLIPIPRKDSNGATPGSDIMYFIRIQTDEAGKAMLSTSPITGLKGNSDTSVQVTLMDLSHCNIEDVLNVLDKPRAIGTREGEVSGFIGKEPYYLGIEENPFV